MNGLSTYTFDDQAEDKRYISTFLSPLLTDPTSNMRREAINTNAVLLRNQDPQMSLSDKTHLRRKGFNPTPCPCTDASFPEVIPK